MYRASVNTRWLVSALVGFAASAGCQSTLFGPRTQTPDNEPTPTLELMKRTYDDLASGRFVVLADFNTTPQAELLRVVGADAGDAGASQPRITPLRSRDETGAGGLEAHLRPGDRLLFDGQRSEQLALWRDWSDYALLLLSVYGPPGGVELEFTIEDAPEQNRRFSQRLLVKPQWNLFRFDLEEVAESIDLSDVRALSLAAPGLTSDLTVYLDDLILADNTEYILGANAVEGGLYAFQRGRRMYVGARDRFELAFADGVINGWRPGSGGPNLTLRTGLGPWPLPLPQDWYLRRENPIAYDDPELFRRWGSDIAVTQQLLETGPFRVVVEGRRTFGAVEAENDLQSTDRPTLVWRYTIYPSGEVYIGLRCAAGERGWPSARVAYAVALDARQPFQRIEPEPGYATGEAVTFALLSLTGRERPDLLWSIADVERAKRQVEWRSADERRVAITMGDLEPIDDFQTAHLLRVWPHDIDGVAEAETFAGDYQHPARVTVSNGALVTDAPGDIDTDGFNECEGLYELRPTGDLVRFRFEPGVRLRHRPMFRVAQSEQRECWVYADGRILRSMGRDRDGRLLFVLPWTVDDTLTIEVNMRPAPGASQAHP